VRAAGFESAMKDKPSSTLPNRKIRLRGWRFKRRDYYNELLTQFV
jgi:hypothetical protein